MAILIERNTQSEIKPCTYIMKFKKRALMLYSWYSIFFFHMTAAKLIWYEWDQVNIKLNLPFLILLEYAIPYYTL